MTGALLQLAALGNQDIFFTGNPQMSYFKSVFKRHSNFSMENIYIPFEGSPKLNYDTPITIYAKIPYYGELLKSINFEFEIPEIDINLKTPKTPNIPFRWVNNLGTSIINKVRVFIGSELIETIEGEYIDIYHNVNLTKEQNKIFNQMTGNIPSLFNPYFDSDSNIPITPKRKISVPLPLWFSRYDGVEIPLISLGKIPIKLEIELKSIKQLYHIGVEQTVPKKRIFYRTPNTVSEKISWLYLRPSIAANYIYLSDEEAKLLKTFEHKYLIDKVSCKEFIGNINEKTIELELFSPTKEIYIVPRRDDAISNNQHSNYTTSDSLDNMDPFLKQNYLYQLCYNFYNAIIQRHHKIMQQYTEIINSDIRVINNNGDNVNKTSLEPQPIPNNISPLYYYTLFKDSGNSIPSVTDRTYKFNKKNNTNSPEYPIINKVFLTTFNNALGKEEKEEVFKITNRTESDIILETGNLNIYPTENDIIELANNWNFRSISDIPSINNNNYTYFTENIIKSMEIRFNGDVRLGERDYDYFHKIQPFSHHTGLLPKGVLLYSFSINPEKYQPSGACNFSNFKSIELILKFKSPKNNEAIKKQNIKYDFKLYTTSYNILKIDNGECQLLFKS